MNAPDDGIPTEGEKSDFRASTARDVNMTFEGQPGPWATRIGSTNLKLGDGMTFEDFTPMERLIPPSDPTSLSFELRQGLNKLYGTPLLHHSQQMLAIQYGHTKSFGGSPVTFQCHWSHYETGMVTVRGENLIQEVTRERRH